MSFFYLISLLHSTLMDLCTKNYSCEKTAVKYVTYNYVKIKHIGTIWSTLYDNSLRNVDLSFEMVIYSTIESLLN